VELWRFHVIRVPAKGIKPPSRIDRVRRRVTPAAEIDEVGVGYTRREE
jgi:hypothetical protein